MKRTWIMVALLAMACGVQAGTLTWASTVVGGEGTDWAVANNWFDGVGASATAPVAGDTIQLGDLFGNVIANWPTVDSAGQAAATVIVGQGDTAELNITTGGELTVSGFLYVGNSHVGTLTMTGGTLDVGNLRFVNSGQAGHIDLHGGTINATAMNFDGTGLSTIDVQGDGVLITGGDQTAAMDFLISEGWITGGAGLASTYDGGSNTTTLAIPEPATMGLFVLIGGGMLWIRKRFMI
jgi:hypothetical protein